MKCLCSSLLSFLLAHSLTAQRVQVTYGTHFYRDNLLGQLNTLRDPAFGNPVQSVGVSLTGVTGDRTSDVHERVTLNKYLPQAIRVNDSVTGKISGWSVGMDMGKDLFLSSERIDVLFMLGFSTGRMKLVRQGQAQFEKSGNILHVTNGFFSPRGSVVFNASVKRFCFTLGAQYCFDISATRWKEKLLALDKPASVDVPGFRQTHLEIFAGIGWNFWSESATEETPPFY